MEHKKKQSQAELPTGGSSGRAFDGDEFDEFDDVETSSLAEIAEDTAPEHGSVAKGDHVRVMNAKLASRPRAKADEVLHPGFRLSNRFEIVELVRSGGMGHVYKAIDHRRHRDGAGQVHVGIKMMRGSVATQRQIRLALEREAAQAQLLSHPNIINVFDFDEHDQHFYLVMEWLEGESVKDLLRRTAGQRIAPEFAWSIIEKTAAGLEYAHRHNVVHADINPGNIFITDAQEIKLLDFGLARTGADSEDQADERTGWVTQAYASPQVLAGAAPVFADDIFSLACIAYRLLSGKHPFAGSSSRVAKREGVKVEPIAGLAVSEWQVLSRALSYERSDRPKSADAFAREPAFVDESSIEYAPQLRRTAHWPRLATAIVIVIAIGSIWLWQGASDDEPVANVEETVVDEPPVVTTEAASQPTEIDTLLSKAAQAMDEERYVLPEDNNARFLYREALAIGPENALARAGLRTISDVYVRRADAALRVADPIGASAYLTIAAETDTANPAIAIVNSLLVAQGDRYLVDARLAAARGDAVRVANLLLMAEQYEHIDSNSINAIREQIKQSARDAQRPERRPEAARIASSTPREQVSSAVTADAAPATADDADIMAMTESPSGANAAGAQSPGTNATDEPQPEAVTTKEPPQPRYRQLQDLGIQKYVPPRFPRSARRRGRSGFVEVAFDVNRDGSTGAIEIIRAVPGEIFDSSAVDAVEQWRFAPQEDRVRALVTLRFAVQP